jgi:hypothetical protein
MFLGDWKRARLTLIKPLLTSKLTENSPARKQNSVIQRKEHLRPPHFHAPESRLNRA